MKKIITFVLILSSVFLIACDKQAADAAGGKGEQKVSESSQQMVSSGGFIILERIKLAGGNEEKTILLDKGEWLKYAPAMGIPMDHDGYRDFMNAHADVPIEADAETFAKLSNYEAPPADPEISAMALDDVLENYFTLRRLKYYLTDDSKRADRGFLRALLEKGCSVRRDCESGVITVDYIPPRRR